MANGPVVAAFADQAARTVDVITEVRREEALLKTGALQNTLVQNRVLQSEIRRMPSYN